MILPEFSLSHLFTYLFYMVLLVTQYIFVCQTLYPIHVSQHCDVLKSHECGLLVIAVPHCSH